MEHLVFEIKCQHYTGGRNWLLLITVSITLMVYLMYNQSISYVLSTLCTYMLKCFDSYF